MAGVRELKHKDDMIDHSKDWTNTGSFVNKPSKGWLHPNDQLRPDAGVCYGVRYVGCMEVMESMKALNFETRTLIAKESINMVAEAAGIKTRVSKKNSKIRALLGPEPQVIYPTCSVTVCVTTSAIDIVAETGEIIAHHEMPGISFASGGEEDTQDFVAYVAKDDVYRRSCHVLECGQELAQDVITTIGQAFELRFKMFLAEQVNIGRNVMRVEPAQFEKNSNNWGNDDEYYNDRPGLKPPSPTPNNHREPSPHAEYSIPTNNTSKKAATAMYSSIRSDQRNSNLIDFGSDSGSLMSVPSRSDENWMNYDTPRPIGLDTTDSRAFEDRTLMPSGDVTLTNGPIAPQSRGYQNVTLSQPSNFPPPPPHITLPDMPSTSSAFSLPPAPVVQPFNHSEFSQTTFPPPPPPLTAPRPQPMSASSRSSASGSPHMMQAGSYASQTMNGGNMPHPQPLTPQPIGHSAHTINGGNTPLPQPLVPQPVGQMVNGGTMQPAPPKPQAAGYVSQTMSSGSVPVQPPQVPQRTDYSTQPGKPAVGPLPPPVSGHATQAGGVPSQQVTTHSDHQSAFVAPPSGQPRQQALPHVPVSQPMGAQAPPRQQAPPLVPVSQPMTAQARLPAPPIVPVSQPMVTQALPRQQGVPPPAPPRSVSNEGHVTPPTPNTANSNFDMTPVCRTLPRGAPVMPQPISDIQVLPYNEPWFHGKVSRQKCEELLRENGQFLVRESATTPGQFVLSGCQNGAVRHLLLVDPNGIVRTKDRTFSSIAHLIDFHVKNRLPISSNDTELELRVPLIAHRTVK